MATQDNWRFCTKCYSLFWNGYSTQGVCPEGGAHSPNESASPTHAASSLNFELQADNTNTPSAEPWRGWRPQRCRHPGQLALLYQVLQPVLVRLPDGRALPRWRSAQSAGVCQPHAPGEQLGFPVRGGIR